jgi:hypothetical protein
MRESNSTYSSHRRCRLEILTSAASANGRGRRSAGTTWKFDRAGAFSSTDSISFVSWHGKLGADFFLASFALLFAALRCRRGSAAWRPESVQHSLALFGIVILAATLISVFTCAQRLWHLELANIIVAYLPAKDGRRRAIRPESAGINQI